MNLLRKNINKQASKQGLTRKYSLEHAVIRTKVFWSQAYLWASHFGEFKGLLLASNWCKIKVNLFHFNEWSKIIYHSIYRPKVSAFCTSSTGRNRKKKTTLVSWKKKPHSATGGCLRITLIRQWKKYQGVNHSKLIR